MTTTPKKTTSKKEVKKLKKIVKKSKSIDEKLISDVVEKKKTIRRNYIYAVGRRKSAIARARYYRKGSGDIIVNNKSVDEYFPFNFYRQSVQAPMKLIDDKLEGDFTIRVHGGGPQGQVEAIRLSIARLLVKINKDFRSPLKRAGYLKRDPRIKERKKYGLKRARRAPQWQKR
ncbi:30S ribosomal protein S9 [Patescibacteria group bacterium]